MGIAAVAIIRTLTRFSGAALRFFVTGYIAVVLGPATLGYYALYRTVTVFTSIPADLGLSPAAVKRLSEGDEMDSYFTAFLLLSGFLTTVVLGGIILLEEIISKFIGQDIIIFVALGLVGQISINVVNSTLIGENKVKEQSYVELTQKLTTSIAQLLLLIPLDLGLIGIILGEHVGMLAVVVLGGKQISSRLTRPRLRHIVRLGGFSKYAWATPISQRVRAKVDTFVLGLLFPASTVGIYELVWTISSVFSYFPTALRTVLFPELSERTSAGATETHRIGSQAITYAVVTILPGIVGALIVGDELLSLFSTAYMMGYTALVIITLARVSMCLFDILNSYYFGIDSPRRAFYGTVIMILSNVILNVIFIYLLGLTGAAVATFVSFSIASMYLFLHAPDIWSAIDIGVIFRGAVSALLMGLIVWLIQPVITPVLEPTITMSLIITMGGVSFAAPLLFLFPRLRARVVTTLLYALFKSKRVSKTSE